MYSTIKRKLKICSVCQDPCILWKANPPMCKNCAQMEMAKNEAKSCSVPKRTPLKSKPVKINPISKNRQEALKKYRRLRDKYFEEHPICQYPGCNSKNITLHHAAGRCGAFLTDKRHFRSLCHVHHRFCEENPLEAIKLGLSVKRLDKFQ